jgi:hypothetical protein
MNNPDHISQSLETIVWVKILNFFGEKVGSGINIPDSQDCQKTDKKVIYFFLDIYGFPNSRNNIRLFKHFLIRILNFFLEERGWRGGRHCDTAEYYTNKKRIVYNMEKTKTKRLGTVEFRSECT